MNHGFKSVAIFLYNSRKWLHEIVSVLHFPLINSVLQFKRFDSHVDLVLMIQKNPLNSEKGKTALQSAPGVLSNIRFIWFLSTIFGPLYKLFPIALREILEFGNLFDHKLLDFLTKQRRLILKVYIFSRNLRMYFYQSQKK